MCLAVLPTGAFGCTPCESVHTRGSTFGMLLARSTDAWDRTILLVTGPLAVCRLPRLCQRPPAVTFLRVPACSCSGRVGPHHSAQSGLPAERGGGAGRGGSAHMRCDLRRGNAGWCRGQLGKGPTRDANNEAGRVTSRLREWGAGTGNKGGMRPGLRGTLLCGIEEGFWAWRCGCYACGALRGRVAAGPRHSSMQDQCTLPCTWCIVPRSL